MIDVAILTPDPAEVAYPDLWPKVLARLQRALDGAGIRGVPTPWTAYVDDASALRGYARVLSLLVWGYHHDHARWLRACATWGREGVAMSNPAPVLAWNSNKRYLLELAERGIAIPRSICSDEITREVLDRAFAEFDTDELIVKPMVSGGAWKTQRLKHGDEFVASSGVAMLIQPYLSTIETAGETSLLYFGGQLSHAVNKRPPAGEFRVQEEFGGLYQVLPEVPAAALTLAERVLATIGEPLLYARIDMVPDGDGCWLLMEAELIEPDFYLGVDPEKGAGFASALRDVVE